MREEAWPRQEEAKVPKPNVCRVMLKRFAFPGWFLVLLPIVVGASVVAVLYAASDAVTDEGAWLLRAEVALLLLVTVAAGWSLHLRSRMLAHAREVERSEARLRHFFDYAPVAIIEEDFTAVVGWLEGLRKEGVTDLREWLAAEPARVREQFARIRVVAVNRTLRQHTGTADEAGFQRQMVATATPEALRAFGEELVALWERRTDLSLEITYTRATGEAGHSLMHWSVPVMNGRPDPSRVLLVFSDLTAQRTVEAQLRESEERWRLAVRGSNAGIWEFNYVTGRSFFSDQWKKLIGFAADEIGERREEWLDRIHPDDRARVEAAMKAHLERREEFYEAEHRLHCKDGTYRWILSRGQALFDEAGKPLRIIGSHSDIHARKEAEAAWQASEQRWQLAFRGSRDGIWEFNSLTRRCYYSDRWKEMLGHEPHEISDAPEEWSDRIHPDDAERVFAAAGDHNRGLTPFYTAEFRMRCKDGSYKWILARGRAIFGPDGRVLRTAGSHTDITERKLADEALRRSEERFRSLFEHSPVAIMELDYRAVARWLGGLRAQGVTDFRAYAAAHPRAVRWAIKQLRISNLNTATLRVFGARTKAELLAGVARLLTREAWAARVDALAVVWDGRTEFEGERVMRQLDGGLRRLHFRWWMPRPVNEENLGRVQLAWIDLTEMERAEAALAAERERLSVTLRAMTEAVITADADGRVLFLNDAAAGLTDWTADEALGRAFEEVCVLREGRSQEPVASPVRAAIAGGGTADLPRSSLLMTRMGRPVQVEGRCAPIRDGEGRTTGAVLVLRDVTERARLESEMQRASKLDSLGVLAGGIAHDFNNLLTVVLGNLTLAMLDGAVMERTGRWLRDAERGALRARDLTQQLLTFAKGGDPVRRTVRLADLVKEAAEFALHGAPVKCDLAVAADLWPADVDQGQVSQVVQNLVINAVQAMPGGGTLRVELRNERLAPDPERGLAGGPYLCMVITDTGVGIGAEHLARIFDPYFTTKANGTGLGLATVYSIVKKHHGHVVAESEPGLGTTFRIWLPAQPAASPAAPEGGSGLDAMAGRVLFMDDEENIRLMATALLGRLGFEVETVADGAEAVQAYAVARSEGRPFALVVMDLTVPGGMGGMEAMRELLKIDPEVKAIVSSGYSSDPVMANYQTHGFKGTVPKPYKITDLAKAVRRVLEGA